MCALWELDECLPDGRPDVEKLAACCTEDVVFMVGPSSRPLVGREAAKKGWTLPDGWSSAGWSVLAQITVGDTVMNERIDRFDVGGTIVAMPCAVRYPPPVASAVSALCPLTGSGL